MLMHLLLYNSSSMFHITSYMRVSISILFKVIKIVTDSYSQGYIFFYLNHIAIFSKKWPLKKSAIYNGGKEK